MSTSSGASRDAGKASPALSERPDAARAAAAHDAARDAAASSSQTGTQSGPSGSVEPSAVARAVSGLHDSVGNSVISASLAGFDVGGMGPVVADGLTTAVGGLDSGEVMGSNASMGDVMRDAILEEGLDMEAANRAIAASSGRPLAPHHQERFERAFDHDFGHVRVHTSGTAAMAAKELNAHAFALGAEVFFGAGEFAPGTAAGDRLLAHELTHVVQHDQGRLPGGGGVSKPTDPHEVEAYANEGAIVVELSHVDAEMRAERSATPTLDASTSDGVADRADLGEDRAEDVVDGGLDTAMGGSETALEAGSSSEQLGADVGSLGAEFDLPEQAAPLVEMPDHGVDSDLGEVDLGGALTLEAGGGFASAAPSDADAAPVDAGPALMRRAEGASAGAGGASAGRRRRVLPAAVAKRMEASLGGELSDDIGADAAAVQMPSLGIDASEHADAPVETETVYERLDEVGALVGEPPTAQEITRGGVTDADAERQAQTLDLLARLGATLGLSGIRVRVDEAATQRVRALGTRGVMENGQVLLDADAYDPSTLDGQALLAHEVMHVAQDRLSVTDSAATDSPSTEAAIDAPQLETTAETTALQGISAGALAEGEADAFADAFVAGRATPDAMIAIPETHSAQENPASGLKDSYLKFDELMTVKKDNTDVKTQATAPPPKDEVEETKENREAKLDAYEDGLEDVADEIEDKDAFDDLGDAIDDEEYEERDKAMNKIRGTKDYKDMKGQWTGAKNAEHDSGKMKSMFDDKFYDRGWGDDEDAWNYITRKAKAEATEDELAAEAKASAEESKGKEKPGDPEKSEGEGVENGEGDGGANGAGGEAGLNPRASEEVPKELPASPNFDAALEKKQNIAPLVNKEWTHYDKHTGEIQKAAESGPMGRGAVIFQEVGSQFLGGAAKGFIGGFQDAALDTVGEFGDKALTGLSKGKLPPKVSYVGSAVSLYQSGLLTGDFKKFGDTQKQAIDKIGKSATSGMEMWSKAGEASGVDAFGLYCASIADWLQAAIDTIDMVANLLGTLSAICYVVGGVMILCGLALLWLAGAGAPLVSAGTWLVRAGNTIGKIKDVLDKITAILKPIRTVLRVIAAFTVPADVFAEQVGALGDTAEAYGEDKAKTVASTTVQEMKDHATKDKDPANDKEGSPEEKTTGEAEGQADGDLSKKNEQIEKDIAEIMEGQKKVQEGLEATQGGNKKKPGDDDDDDATASTKPKEDDGEESGTGKKTREDLLNHGKEAEPTSLGGKIWKANKEKLAPNGLNPIKNMKAKFTDLGTSIKSAKEDLNSYKEGSELKKYEMMLANPEANGGPDGDLARQAKQQLDDKKKKLAGELKQAEIEARNKLNQIDQIKKNNAATDDPSKKRDTTELEAEFKKLQTELGAADKAYNDAVALEQKIAQAEHMASTTKADRDDAADALPGQKDKLAKDKEAADAAASEYEKAEAAYKKKENEIKAKEAVVTLRDSQVFFKPGGKGKSKAATVLYVKDGELVVQTDKGQETIPFSSVDGPNKMESAISDLQKAETGPNGIKPQDIGSQGLATDISLGRSDLEADQKKLDELKKDMEAKKSDVTAGEKDIADNTLLSEGPAPKPDAGPVWKQVFSKDAKGIDTKEAKSLLGLLASGIKMAEAPAATPEEEAAKKKKEEEDKNKSDREKKVDTAAAALQQSDEDKKKADKEADDKKGPFTKANEWWGNAGKSASDSIVYNLSGPRVSELVGKKPPNDMEEMSKVYEEAEAEAELYSKKHMQAYEAFQAEKVAKDEITMQDFLIQTGDQQLKPAVEKQAEPLAKGKADAQARDGQVDGVDFKTEKSDDALGGFITGLIERLMSNDEYVEGSGEGTEEMGKNSTDSQDKVDEDAKENKKEMSSGSKDTIAVVDEQETARSEVHTLLVQHTTEVEEKKACDEGLLGEIQSMKAGYLEERDEHKAKMEGKAVEYNELMDGMTVWAADYKKQREAWGENA